MSGVAVEDHRDFHAAGNPLGNLDAFGHRQYAEIGKPGVVTAGYAGADETGLDTIGLHDLRVKRIGRTENGEDLIFPPQELP